MAHTYTRTVTVVPSDDNYEWQNPAQWITINQVGSSDTWEIIVSDNTTSQNRSAILTVNHSDGATTNSITVNQAGTGGVQASPTPTPSESAIPPTPTPSSSTIPPTPTPSSSSGPNVNPTFTFNSGTSPSSRDFMSSGSLFSDVSYTITNDGMTSPMPPSTSSDSGGWLTGANHSGPDGTNDPTIFTGVYRFTKQQSGINNTNVDISVPGPYSQSDMWYVTLQFGGLNDKD